MIELDNVSIRLEDYPPVHGVSLRVGEGEVYGLIGLIGSGRSTLIKMLGTLIEPAAGRVRVAGLDPVAQAAQVRRKIGYMADVPGAYDTMRVRAVMQFYARLYKLDGEVEGQRIARLLALAGLENKQETYVQDLEPEEQQRLHLVKTLIHEPEVLLLDNPALGLGAAARGRLRELIGRVRPLCRAILIGSNILSDLTGLCGRLGVMHGGQLVAEGPSAEIARQLRPACIIEVEIQGDGARALEAAGRDNRIEQCELHGQHLIFNMRAEEEPADPAAVAAGLQGEGFRAAAWREHEVEIGQLVEPRAKA